MCADGAGRRELLRLSSQATAQSSAMLAAKFTMIGLQSVAAGNSVRHDRHVLSSNV